MRNENRKIVGSAAGGNRPHLPARVYYGVIVAGVVFGVALAVFGGYMYLESGDRKPAGRRIWDGAAEGFVLPICAMVGGTFGGLAGFAAAAVLEARGRRTDGNQSGR